MNKDLQEQACWLLLGFESGLPTRIVNDIIIAWCQQLSRPLSEFFAADLQEWRNVCQLNEKLLKQLESAKEKLAGQAFLVEQLLNEGVHILTVLDDAYPKLLKSALKRNYTPPVLFYAGDLHILECKTIAIIGSRNASESSIGFTQAVAQFLAEHGANVISGNARGVDRAAYDGVAKTSGCTTIVLPHGIHKLSSIQMRSLIPKIEAGKVLLLSQFHPDAPWFVSRAMERNRVVTGLAQAVIVAESDTQGGTWEGANGALKQLRPLYVRQADDVSLPGNKALIELGGIPLGWPLENPEEVLVSLLEESETLQQKQKDKPARPDQPLLFVSSSE
jgi:DNA processing protein